MIALTQARSLIAEKILPLPAHSAPLGEASGRILRVAASAAEDLPAFDRSAMDGYAVGLDDHSPSFRLIGENQPGDVPEIKIGPGECVRIFTGSRIPTGASQVIMQEQVDASAGIITPRERNQFTNIRYQGEDARRGDQLLPAGTKLGAGELSLLASFGIVLPSVSPAVEVAHFVTGNELIAPGKVPATGQIRDSNSTLVAELLRSWGGHLVQQERVADDFALLENKVRAADRTYDLLLISGGASVGDYDFGRRLLTALGFQIHFDKINLRPGKPLIFGTREAQAAFILPGNPVSHFVTLQTAVRLALETFSGAPVHWPLVKARLTEGFPYRPDQRETYWPARVSLENGRLAVRALRWQSSGDVTGLTGVNALLQFARGEAAPQAGDELNTLLIDLP